ncbi:outer membrane protein assembly factor BamB family protein [Halorubrum ezzemoulense]|uniref:outer membrane protein assembly factor BamB family protein n=1 Tax=Halorubrum ezzemoulense TaxID=337243 RepID=UPI0034E0B31A
MQWQFEPDGWIQSPIVTDGEIVYVASMDHKVYALRATDGRLHWKYDTGDAVNQCIVITDQSLIVGNTEGELSAISDKNQ